MERRRFLVLGCAGLLAAAGVTKPAEKPGSIFKLPAAPALLSSPVPSSATEPVAAPIAPLTPQQIAALRVAALKYTADSPQAAQKLALELHFMDGKSESPANLDGPLALQILLAAGLLDRQALQERLGSPTTPVLKSVWMANPADPDQRKLFAKIFPRATHELVVYDEPAYIIDFTRRPLMPGDFVYSRGGSLGHDRAYLVTEVDDAGRAWTVASLPFSQAAGQATQYIIRRVMLYDPHRPGDGQIAAWGSLFKSPNDLTGMGGLVVYRFKSRDLCPSPSNSCTPLETSLNQFLLQSGGTWHILVRDLASGVLYQRGSLLDAIHPASTIKLALAMLFMQWMEATRRPDNLIDSAMPNTGLTFRQVLYQMMVISNEDAAAQVTNFLFKNLGKPGIRAALDLWGAFSTEIEPRVTNMGNMAALLEGLWQKTFLRDPHSQWILDWMHARTPGDHGRIWTLAEALPPGSVEIWDKRGSLAEATPDGTGLSIVADVGIARIQRTSSSQPAREVLLFIHGVPEKGLKPFPYQETYEELEQISADFIRELVRQAGW